MPVQAPSHRVFLRTEVPRTTACATIGGGGALSNALFKLLDDGQKIAGFKRLNNDAVGFDAVGVFRLIRLHLADGEQHWGLQCVQRCRAHLFADFQAGIARHVNVKDDDVGLLLGDFLHRSSAVADSHNVIARFGKDLLAHVLGSHAVIGK